MIGIAGVVGGAIFVLTVPATGLAGCTIIVAFMINAIITLLQPWDMKSSAPPYQKPAAVFIVQMLGF
jgi:hypothetical protein